MAPAFPPGTPTAVAACCRLPSPPAWPTAWNREMRASQPSASPSERSLPAFPWARGSARSTPAGSATPSRSLPPLLLLTFARSQAREIAKAASGQRRQVRELAGVGDGADVVDQAVSRAQHHEGEGGAVAESEDAGLAVDRDPYQRGLRLWAEQHEHPRRDVLAAFDVDVGNDADLGVARDVRIEHGEQLFEVPTRAGGDEAFRDLPLLGGLDRESGRRRLLLHAPASPACQLAAGGWGAADDRRHVLEGELKDVVQDERSALGRSQLFEKHKQRHAHAVVER